MSQYVCARIIRLDNVDLGLFDYDRNNTLYFFIMNADEQIYMRYGGRDPQSPDTYLNLDSIELALKKGLEIHKDYQAGKVAKAARPKPMFAREFPLLVERTFARNACVECHLVGDYQNIHREQDGTLDKLKHLYRSPDIKTIGIHLDVPKGLLVKEAKGAVAEAGMKAGDTLAAVNGVPVYTFGDFQHQYDKVDRAATEVEIGVVRDGAVKPLNVSLPKKWWWTDIRYRQQTTEPRPYFETRPLTAQEKKDRGLAETSFAGEVKQVDMFAQVVKSHDLKVGDIVTAVDGVSEHAIADNPELYIRLVKKAGEGVTLDVIRGSDKLKMPLKTYRMSFRK